MYARCVKNVRLPGTLARLCRCSEIGVNSCSDDVRLPGMPGCPEICPAARKYVRKYVRLPGNMPGCPVCPAVRKYARLPGCPKCPVCPAVRLSGTMPGCPEICPASALRLRMDAQRRLSAAPLATSTDRHERRCATTPHDRAQRRGRASGVRCKAMLGPPWWLYRYR